MKPGPTAGPIAPRFWSRVDRSAGPNSCWPWIGGKDDEGYGRFYVDVDRSCVRANRFALELDGREAFPWEDVAHSCDFPPCVNPAHLSPCSHMENLRQMAARGRMRGGFVSQRLPQGPAATAPQAAARIDRLTGLVFMSARGGAQ